MTVTVKELIEKLQKFATEPDIVIKDVEDKVEFKIIEVNCSYSVKSLYNTLHIVIREKTKDEQYEDDD